MFEKIIRNYKKITKDKIGNSAYKNLSNSYEIVVLISLSFNNPSLIGTNLANAIKNNNRVATW
ncbi:hypothetical protein F1B92_05340 [Campylobacter sp. FMV-PI01]|uniref:Uncharacterized protein n=1 Tax=Campylobacter portucalensis TaxID=2608384 RepID=A0A6L5WLA1_9BACT|nr:hypothetical protein [Campylobacter portucalensis]MSN96593.1 hypothetical protein [Campylobacter portucalensis]